MKKSAILITGANGEMGHGLIKALTNDMNKNIISLDINQIDKDIKPYILIDYVRRPYVNKFGLYFRLTFDNNLFSTRANNLFSDKKHLSWLECKAGYTILEVKFDRSIPAWFHRVIQSYNLNRRSISKFTIGMSTCGIANETSD